MYKKIMIISAILFMALPISSIAQYGTVDNSSVVESDILDREMSYSVYLPESYHTSTRNYPVMYLLHGMTGDHNDWINLGEVLRIAGKSIADGDAPEMIIIMPDGLYDAFYINNYDGSIKWEDFFHEEFIPEVESRYRVDSSRNSRAIAGLSMGGYGALYHGVNHKETFSAVYAMSGAFLKAEPIEDEDERSDWDREFQRKTWGPLNDQGLPENYKEHSMHEIFRAMDPVEPPRGEWVPGGEEQIPLPDIFIDCGDDDFLLKENTSLVHIMNKKNVPFEFRVHDGGHTWEYWRTALEKTMVFIGDNFRN